MALRDRIHKPHVLPQPVRLAQGFLDMPFDILHKCLLFKLRLSLLRTYNESERALAHVLVRDCDDSCFVYCCMAEQLCFDLCGRDLDSLGEMLVSKRTLSVTS